MESDSRASGLIPEALGIERNVMKVRKEYSVRHAVDNEGFRSTPAAESRRRLEASLARLRRRLLGQLLELHDESTHLMLRRAAADAAALAWTTPSAVLFFPMLLEEKVREGLRYLDRQNSILERLGVSEQCAA